MDGRCLDVARVNVRHSACAHPHRLRFNGAEVGFLSGQAVVVQDVPGKELSRDQPIDPGHCLEGVHDCQLLFDVAMGVDAKDAGKTKLRQ